MINKNMTLQSMLQSKINAEDFNVADEDTNAIVKITVVSSLEERAHDLIHAMFKEERHSYSLNLFEKIQETSWFDFVTPDKTRFILIWQLESVADSEELSEYFEEVLADYNQAYGDVVIEIKDKDNQIETLKLYTHEDKILKTIDKLLS